jgi:hypothetical protein
MPKKTKFEYVLKPFRPAKKTKNENLVPTDHSFCDEPPPPVVFDGRSFCLTGVFEFENGDRNRCEEAVRARGGTCVQRPNHSLDYLVVGTFVEPAWAHKSFGRKIEIALELKRYGSKCKIVSEAQWATALRTSPELPGEKQTSTGGPPRNSQIDRLQSALDEMQSNQDAMIKILKRALKPSDYQRILRLFHKAGIAGHTV